jgi:hypothetical protein
MPEPTLNKEAVASVSLGEAWRPPEGLTPSYRDCEEEEFDGPEGLAVEPVLPWGRVPDDVVGPVLSGADPLSGSGCTPCELVGLGLFGLVACTWISVSPSAGTPGFELPCDCSTSFLEPLVWSGSLGDAGFGWCDFSDLDEAERGTGTFGWPDTADPESSCRTSEAMIPPAKRATTIKPAATERFI